MKVEVREGSVTDADVDVLVNASNTLGQLGSGVSHAIRVACGRGFQEVIDGGLEKRGGSMAPGDVFLTHAGKHPRARFVMHVAVMDYRDAAKQPWPDAARIRRGCERLWPAVDALPRGAYSIGMVALGGGTGGLGERLPTEIACETLKARPWAQIDRVVFNGWGLLGYVNVLDVVARHFDVDMSAVPDEVREHLARLRG